MGGKKKKKIILCIQLLICVHVYSALLYGFIKVPCILHTEIKGHISWESFVAAFFQMEQTFSYNVLISRIFFSPIFCPTLALRSVRDKLAISWSVLYPSC